MAERDREEREPRENETSFRLLVESVQDYGIFMLDPEGRIITWNRGAERIKGYSEDEIVGQHFSTFYTPEDLERDYPEYELKVAAREGRFEDEGWRVRKDGTRFWANVVITALRDDAGRLAGFGKVTRDLTERVHAEAVRTALERERLLRKEAEELAEELQIQALQLEETQAELERANDRLQHTNQELVTRTEEAEWARTEADAANRSKSAFLANMSHELRTPINAVIGYTDILEMGVTGPVTGAQRAQLERIRVSSRHLVGLIEEILDFSKLEAGRISVTRDPGWMGEAVEAALALVEPQAAEKGLQVSNGCSRETDQLFIGDDDRVRQIMANLLSNAIKFTEPGGRVEIRCDSLSGPGPGPHLRGQGPWLRVRVRDTGIGIPPEHQDTVFEAFVQVETARARARGGSGLGLAISRQLARLMGGDITLESEPGEGSCFSLWIPGAPAEVAAERPGPDTALTAEHAGSGTGLPNGVAPEDLAGIGAMIQSGTIPTLRAINRRLRADPLVEKAADLSEPELEDHQGAFIYVVAHALSALTRDGDRSDLLQDSSDIQWHIARRHGAQRARLGWTETALRRELEILGEELETVGMRAAENGAGDADAFRETLGWILAHAGAATLSGHRWESTRRRR